VSQPQNRAPEGEAAREARLREAVKLRDGGMSYTQLGDHFDVGRERAKLLVERGRKLPPEAAEAE
jgi:transposase